MLPNLSLPFLIETNKQVFFDPDEELFDRYARNHDEVIIVKNMISESPLVEREKTVIPMLEKLLVDMQIDTELYSAQQSEKEYIMRSVLQKYSINHLKMRRYARRRNRAREITQLIKITSHKYPGKTTEVWA